MSRTQTLSTDDLSALELELVRDLVAQGDLTCLLHSSQLEALAAFESAPGSRFVLEVARRWGKTFLLLIIALIVCGKKPRTRVVYGAPTLKHLGEFILPTFEELAELFSEAQRPRFNSGNSHIECPNGSYIHLFGADDKRKADRGRGPEAALAIFDEAGFCPLLRYVLKSVFRPSLMHSGGRTIIASTPAEQPDHDFTAMAERAEALGAYFNRTVWDNPRLTEARIKKFIEEDATDDGVSVEQYMQSDDFRREYLAERVINRLLLAVPEWVAPWKDGRPYRESHLVAVPRPKLFRGHTIIDFGGNDPHASQLGYWHGELGIVIERDMLLTKDERSRQLGDAVKELEGETWGVNKWDGTLAALTTQMLHGHFGATKQSVPDWLMPELDKEDVPAQPFVRICDTNMELARHLHSIGLAVIPTYKTEKQYMVLELRNLIAAGKYWVHPDCKATDRHLRVTTWRNEKRKEWARRGGEHGDLVDTSVYFAMGVCRDLPADPEAAVAPQLTVGAMLRARQKLEERQRGFSEAFMGESKLAKKLRGR